MSWTCHEHVMNMPWTCREHVVNMSWTCCEHVVNRLWTCREHVVNMLCTCCEHVVNKLSTGREHAMNMSWTCHEACCEHVVNISGRGGEGFLRRSKRRRHLPKIRTFKKFGGNRAFVSCFVKKGLKTPPLSFWTFFTTNFFYVFHFRFIKTFPFVALF